MQDHKLEQRKTNFQKTNVDIVGVRQEHKLRLRREKIDEFIMKKREKLMEKNEKSVHEIKTESLILPSEILNRQYSSIDECMEFIKELLLSSDINYIKFGILHLRKQLILEVNPPVLELVKNGFMNSLLNLLEKYINVDSIVYEIIWCFTNITADNTSTYSNFFLTPKSFRLFEKIFESGKVDITYNLLWLLTHICDSENGRDSVMASEVFTKLLDALEAETTNFLIIRHGIWLISTVSKGFNGEMRNIEMFERILNILCFYLKAEDQDITSDVLYGLANFTNTKFLFSLRRLIDTGVITFIIKMDLNTNILLIESAMRIIGNLLTGDDLMTDEILKYGVLSLLDRYLFHSNASIRREAAWCISNITAGTLNQINAVVEAGLVQRLAELVKDPINDIAREATWAIANCVSGADLNLCFKLANNLAMQGLIYIIIHHQEPTLLGIALEGLYNFFKNGEIVKQIGNGRNPFVDHFINEGAIDYLEKLQEHNNKEIYNITIDMLDQFFPVEQK